MSPFSASAVTSSVPHARPRSRKTRRCGREAALTFYFVHFPRHPCPQPCSVWIVRCYPPGPAHHIAHWQFVGYRRGRHALVRLLIGQFEFGSSVNRKTTSKCEVFSSFLILCFDFAIVSSIKTRKIPSNQHNSVTIWQLDILYYIILCIYIYKKYIIFLP